MAIPHRTLRLSFVAIVVGRRYVAVHGPSSKESAASTSSTTTGNGGLERKVTGWRPIGSNRHGEGIAELAPMPRTTGQASPSSASPTTATDWWSPGRCGERHIAGTRSGVGSWDQSMESARRSAAELLSIPETEEVLFAAGYRSLVQRAYSA